MIRKEAYIKPSVLELDYEVDRDLVTFQTCKSLNNQDGKGNTPGPGSCEDVQSCPSGGAPGAS